MNTKKQDSVVIIVDDGSPVTDHLDWVTSTYPEIRLVHKPENGGIARCKNTCLRALSDAGCDIFFLLDDDFELVAQIEDKYSLALQETGGILSGCTSTNPSIGPYSDNTVQTSILNGFLLCFSTQIFRAAGYFKIFPHKYGHEHTWYTKRMMQVSGQPCFLDISDSGKFYRFMPIQSSMDEEERLQELVENEAALNLYLSDLNYEPCIE
jgi:glycosyltransferase involved in cell wall biosynthesis